MPNVSRDYIHTESDYEGDAPCENWGLASPALRLKSCRKGSWNYGRFIRKIIELRRILEPKKAPIVITDAIRDPSTMVMFLPSGFRFLSTIGSIKSATVVEDQAIAIPTVIVDKFTIN